MVAHRMLEGEEDDVKDFLRTWTIMGRKRDRRFGAAMTISKGLILPRVGASKQATVSSSFSSQSELGSSFV